MYIYIYPSQVLCAEYAWNCRGNDQKNTYTVGDRSLFTHFAGFFSLMGIRRAQPLHYVVAVIVGVASGVALYKEPLERERARQMQAVTIEEQDAYK
jgi:hypothetical protein